MGQPSTSAPALTVVLLPGMDGTGLLFADFLSALGERFPTRVVRYPTDKPLSYDALRTHVASALPEDAPFVILAESFSGPLAISLAAERPAGLKGLILCCTFSRNPRPALALLGRAASSLPLPFLPIGPLGRLLLGKHGTRALRQAFAATIAQVPSRVMQARLKSVLSVDVTDQLARINVPTLYLQATEDRVVPARAGALICENCPTAKLTRIRAPHFLLQTQPHEAAREISSFLDHLP